MRIYKISIEQGGVWAVWKDEKDVREELEVFMENEDEPGRLIIEIAEMTEEEFASLPEFQGF